MRILVSITIKKLLRADPRCRSVIKEFVHAFSCAYIELWMHSGSLLAPQFDASMKAYVKGRIFITCDDCGQQ